LKFGVLVGIYEY